MNINTEKSETKSKHKNNKKPLYICKTRRAASALAEINMDVFTFMTRASNRIYGR